MTLDELARSMVLQASQRMKVLPILLQDGAYSVVVRESQEVAELSLKALLRLCGVEPPKIHDVGRHLLAHREKAAALGIDNVESLAAASQSLRKERELSFYGEADFIPTEAYTPAQAEEALGLAHACLTAAQLALSRASGNVIS
ncbi:MAG: HEPN domain-containing protein [Candidatus Methylacidiphilales bacterium]